MKKVNKDFFDQKLEKLNSNISSKLLFILIALSVIYLVAIVIIFKVPFGFNSMFINYLIFLVIFWLAVTIIFKYKKIRNILIIVLIAYALANIISFPLFSSSTLKSIADREDVKIEDVFAKNTKKFILVDNEFAFKLGDKILGSEKLGNYYHLEQYDDIMYKGRLVSVAPLEYNDFFKYISRGSSPGYVIVDKYTGAVELIKNKEINYLKSAYILDNVNRQFAMNGVFEKYSIRFELDEKGNPYYIANNYTPKFGLGIATPNNVVTMNAETGKVEKYKIGEQPEWIDNVYNSDYLRDEISWNLKYVNGYINTLFAKTEVMYLTDNDAEGIKNSNGSSLVVYNYRYIELDNKLYMYSGVTSVGADESLTGFMISDIITGEHRFISQGAISEIASMESIMGEVQQYKYIASFPILTKIDDKLVYYHTLKDSTGLVKSHGFVDSNNINNFAVGKTLSEAFFNYSKKALKGSNLAVDQQTIKRKIERINFDGKDAYIIFTNRNELFKIEANLSDELAISQPNDNFEISFDDTNNIVFFNNLDIDIK